MEVKKKDLTFPTTVIIRNQEHTVHNLHELEELLGEKVELV